MPCACTYKWCTALRSLHLFCYSTVKVPEDIDEAAIWANLLGIEEFLLISRVSVIHFFEVDMIVKSIVDGEATFDGIDRTQPTRYQMFDTGNSSLVSPARPAASKADIDNSIFYSIKSMTYIHYCTQAASWSTIKKSKCLRRKESIAASVFAATSKSFDSTPSKAVFSAFFDTSNEGL